MLAPLQLLLLLPLLLLWLLLLLLAILFLFQQGKLLLRNRYSNAAIQSPRVDELVLPSRECLRPSLEPYDLNLVGALRSGQRRLIRSI